MNIAHYCTARRPWARFLNALSASRHSPLWLPCLFIFCLGLGLFIGALFS